MNQELQKDGTNQNQRGILGDISNTLGKRPFPFDLDKPSKSTKIAPNNQIPTETLNSKNPPNFQDFFNPTTNNSSNRRHTGNYFAKENYGGMIKGSYFKHLMREPGPGRETSPELEDNFEEDYESDNNEETGKQISSFSGNYFSARNSESLKLGETGKAITGFSGNYFSTKLSENSKLEGTGKANICFSGNYFSTRNSESSKLEETGKTNTVLSGNYFGVKHGENSKLDLFGGLDESCNCSFCIKAAYMWMDLHYQDTRGRLSALNRSKRLARSLEEKLYGQEYKNKTVGESSNNQGAKMEFELMQQWRSLFMHTENLFVHETSQLHMNLMNLEELREKCKKNLHTITGNSQLRK
ncbi:hypothetical protein LUZ60_001178 [Juncus effusus]|nr:hypothetical protein LUZ60_001178 [Juncus effusus]